MNTTRLIAALAVSFAAAGSAMAQEATYDYPQNPATSVTRAAVQADLQTARANGSLVATEADFQKGTPSRSLLTREVVKAQTLAAIASGELQALNGEGHGVDVQPGRTSGRFMGPTAAADANARMGG